MAKQNLDEELSKILKGEVDSSDVSREFYSHDASMFEMVPEVITFPKDTTDIENLVQFVTLHKKNNPNKKLHTAIYMPIAVFFGSQISS